MWGYYDELKAIGLDVEGEIKLANATNPNIETIRNSMIPTQLCQVKSNTGYASEYGIFEVGRVVTAVDENDLCVEKKMLGVTLYSRLKPLPMLYFDLRDILTVLVGDLKHREITFEKKDAAHAYEHPRNLNAILCDGKVIGEIGIVHPTVSKKIDKKAAIVFAQLDVNALAEIENASIVYEEPSKFPEMEIDLSFITNRFEPIANAIKQADCPLIKKVEVTDVYETPDGNSITTRLTFSHPERTLTREEVQSVSDKIVSNLEEKGIHLKALG